MIVWFEDQNLLNIYIYERERERERERDSSTQFDWMNKDGWL